MKAAPSAPGRVCDECTAGVDAMFQEDPVSCWRTARLLIGAALRPDRITPPPARARASARRPHELEVAHQRDHRRVHAESRIDDHINAIAFLIDCCGESDPRSLVHASATVRNRVVLPEAAEYPGAAEHVPGAGPSGERRGTGGRHARPRLGDSGVIAPPPRLNGQAGGRVTGAGAAGFSQSGNAQSSSVLCPPSHPLRVPHLVAVMSTASRCWVRCEQWRTRESERREERLGSADHGDELVEAKGDGVVVLDGGDDAVRESCSILFCFFLPICLSFFRESARSVSVITRV